MKQHGYAVRKIGRRLPRGPDVAEPRLEIPRFAWLDRDEQSTHWSSVEVHVDIELSAQAGLLHETWADVAADLAAQAQRAVAAPGEGNEPLRLRCQNEADLETRHARRDESQFVGARGG